MGTGTLDMVRIAKKFDLKEPVFQQEEYFKTIIFRPSAIEAEGVNPTSIAEVPHKYRGSTVEVQNLMRILSNTEMSRKEAQETLGLKDTNNFREKSNRSLNVLVIHVLVAGLAVCSSYSNKATYFPRL